MAKNPITVLAEGNKLLNDLQKKLVGVNTNLLEISQTARNSNLKDFFNTKAPNEVNEKLKLHKTIITQLNAEVKERDRLEKALSNQLAKNKLVESDLNRELVKQRFETQQRNKNIKASVILSSKLSTEYQKLVTRMNQAGNSLQSLTAKKAQGVKLSNKEQAELKQSQIQFKKYQAAVLKADASVGRFQRNVGNYGSAFGKAGVALRNFAGVFGVFSAGLIAKEIFELTKEIDGLDKALLQVTETQEGFNQAQTFIKELAEEAGVEINGLQKSYTKFFAAAKTTNLTLQETQNIFRQTAKAGAVLGLSTDDINGSMKALEQILSKGKVQAEEIRGQLGERLPGAFQILAKSMGLTTAELSKQLELGNVLSEEVLPGFAEQLAKTYNLNAVNRVDTLTAAQNRLGNAWIEFVRSLDGSDGTLTNIFKTVIDGLTSITKALLILNTTVDDFNKKLASDTVKKQLEQYKELGDQANAYALIDKKRSEEVIANKKAEIKVQEKILEKYKDLNGFQKLIRPEARNAQIEINKLNSELSTQQGILKAAQIQLGEIKVEVKENNDELIKLILSKTKEYSLDQLQLKSKKDLNAILKSLNTNRKEEKEILEGSLASYQKIIRELKDKQGRLATTSEEYENYNIRINAVKESLEKLKGVLKELDFSELDSIKESFEDEETQLEVDILLKGGIESGLKSLAEKLGVPFEDLYAEFENLYETDYKSFLEFSQKKITQSELEETKKREALIEGLETAVAFNGAIGDLGSAIFEGKVQKYEDDIQKNNDYYATLLDNENLSEEQRSAIEAERERKNAELEKKKRKEQRKQAIFNKASALVEIALNTAIAVAKVLGQTGIFGLAASVPIIALGALQAATVLATPIPKYKDGKKEGQGKDGLALLNDGGKDELRISKDGNIERITGRNILAPVLKSDTIIPDAEKFLSNLSDQELYNNIHKHSIMSSMAHQNDTLNAYLLAQNMNKSFEKHSNKMVKAMKANRPNIRVNNNNSIGNDLSFLSSLNNTL